LRLDLIKEALKNDTIEIQELFAIFNDNDLLNKVDSKFLGSHIINKLIDFELEKLLVDSIKKILLTKDDLKVLFFKEFNKRLENFDDNFAEIKLMEIFLNSIYFDFKTFPINLREEFFYLFTRVLRKFNFHCSNTDIKEWKYDSDFWDHEFKDIIGKSLSQFIRDHMGQSLGQREFDEFIFLFQTFDGLESLDYIDLLDLIENSRPRLTEFLGYIKDDIYYDGIKIVIEGYLRNLEEV